MGRGNLQRRAQQREASVKGGSRLPDGVNLADFKRKRSTRNQAPPPTLPNVDVHGILFAVVAIVFVIYPLAQWALGL